MTLLSHRPEDGSKGVEHSEHVDPVHGGHVVQVAVLHRTTSGDPCVGHGDVDMAEVLDGNPGPGVEFLRLGYISGNHEVADLFGRGDVDR